MSFDDLLLLLILLAPLLRRLFQKAKQPQQPRVPQPSREPEHPLGTEPALERAPQDPLAEALRQIREALGEPPPAPAPAPAPTPPPVAKAPPPPRPSPQPERFGLGGFEHDEHGFGRSNPLSEEAFEQRPRGAEPAPRPRPAPPRPRPAAPANADLRRDVLAMLRDPHRAREAFMIQQILAPPLSRTQRR